MKTFNEYWKEKAQKRRKAWAAKARRFAEQHTQLEDIRKDVYLPLDFGANFSFEGYKPEHFIKLNPITSWQDKNFCFSEEGLCAALEAEGADMNSFRMSVSHHTCGRLVEVCTRFPECLFSAGFKTFPLN